MKFYKKSELSPSNNPEQTLPIKTSMRITYQINISRIWNNNHSQILSRWSKINASSNIMAAMMITIILFSTWMIQTNSSVKYWNLIKIHNLIYVQYKMKIKVRIHIDFMNIKLVDYELSKNLTLG